MFLVNVYTDTWRVCSNSHTGSGNSTIFKSEAAQQYYLIKLLLYLKIYNTLDNKGTMHNNMLFAIEFTLNNVD